MCVACGMDNYIHGYARLYNPCLEDLRGWFETCIEFIATKWLTRIEHDESIVQRAKQSIACRAICIHVLCSFQFYASQDHKVTRWLMNLHGLTFAHVKLVEWFLLLISSAARPAMKGE